MVDGIAVDAEEFRGLAYRDVFLALLCALCTVFSHAPMLDPSEFPRKPSEASLAAFGVVEGECLGGVGQLAKTPKLNLS
jgi:hypothetical protein